MKKSEIKHGVKNIVETINNFRKQLDEIFLPINRIKDHFEAIQNLQDEYGVDSAIDFEEAERELVINLIDDNYDYQEIDNSFDSIICDLESWLEDVSEKKQEQIQDDYIEPLEEIRGSLDLSEVFDKDSLDDMLTGIINEIEESGLI